MDDWKADRVGAAERGENPMVMARMRSGFAAIGDTQHLPGYSVLMCGDGSADHLTDLHLKARAEFLLDLALLGEAVENVCRERELRRMNYEVLGNSMPWLHGHVHPRYEWEPPSRQGMPVWCYPEAERDAPEHAYSDARHGALRSEITQELERLMGRAYAERRSLRSDSRRESGALMAEDERPKDEGIEMVERAIDFACMAHRGQVYPTPDGEPYVLHLFRVMLGVGGAPARAAAVLHDILEDTPTTEGDLAEAGMTPEVVEAVVALTHDPSDSYADYIEKLAGNELAREVKLADLADNLANNRGLAPTADVSRRIARYEAAMRRLGPSDGAECQESRS